MKLKILHVLNHLGIGGTELYVVDLTKRLDKNKFEHHIAYASAANGNMQARLDHDVKLFKYSDKNPSFRTLNSFVAPLKLRLYIRRNSIDIVQTYIPPSSAWAWVGASATRTLCTHLIVESLTIGQAFSDALIRHRFLARLCDSMIATYGVMLGYSATEYRSLLGIRSEKLITVGHGVDLKKYQINVASGQAIKREFGIGEHKIVLGSVGRLSKEKEVDFFLRLIPELKKKHNNFVYMIVGDGPEAPHLKALTNKLDLGDTVLFTGIRYDTERIFNAIDCHIFCMRRPLLGIANMQAMACGCPIVVLAQTGVDQAIAAEFVEDGKNGYIARSARQYADVVASLLSSRDRLYDMGLSARRLAEERFDFDKHAQAMESLYLQLGERLSLTSQQL